MNPNSPMVSVCIPSRLDRPQMLAEAIASVRNQSYRDYEILVHVTEGWPDDKFSRLATWAARGKYALILPDDDLLDPEALVQLVVAAEREGAEVVTCDYRLFGDRTDTVRGGPLVPEVWEHRNPGCGLSFLVRRDRFTTMDGFDPGFLYADWEFLIRASKHPVTSVYLPQALVYQRWWGQQGTHFISDEAAKAQLWARHAPYLLRGR